MSDRDYYEILGLTPRADSAMVDQAYWHLVRKYQALAATNIRAQYMIDELNEAYGVIGNPRLREQYDAFRDDVLIRAGMIRPVKSKQKQKEPKQEAAPKQKRDAAPGRERNLPTLQLPQHWRTYSVSAIIALLAFAAAWQGVNIVLVVVALAAGLGFSLTPALTKRISEISFEMPTVTLPAVPKLELPKMDLAMPGLREGATQADEGIDADVLSASTRETIARWRQSVGLKVREPGADGGLVEMADHARERQHDDDDDSEPFAAVMDILRSGSKAVPDKLR